MTINSVNTMGSGLNPYLPPDSNAVNIKPKDSSALSQPLVSPNAPLSTADVRTPKENLLASARIEGSAYFGVGARNPNAGLNWLYLAMNSTEIGAAELKVLNGQTLTKDDKATFRFSGEANGDLIGKIPGIGPKLKELIASEALQGDAGVVLRVVVKGDGKGGIELDNINGFAFVDVPYSKGLVNIDGTGKVGPGINPGEGVTNLTKGFSWNREDGLKEDNNDITQLKILNLFRPPKGASKLDVVSPVFNGWAVAGINNNSDLGVAATGIQAGVSKDSKVGTAISATADAAQLINYFKDFTESLDGKTVQIVNEGTEKGKPFSNTALGVIQGVGPLNIPLFLRGQLAVTGIKDGKQDIDFFSGSTKLFSTSVPQLQRLRDRLIQAMPDVKVKPNNSLYGQMSGIPIVPVIDLNPNVSTKNPTATPSAGVNSTERSEILNAHWVGNPSVARQTLVGTDSKTGETVVSPGAGEIRYANGTTDAQIRSSMADKSSYLWNEGVALAKTPVTTEGKASTNSSLPSPTTPAIGSIPTDSVSKVVGYHYIGNDETGKQLLVGTDPRTGKVIVKDDKTGSTYPYGQGTTDAQIRETMSNPASRIYNKGLELPQRYHSDAGSKQDDVKISAV